MIILALHLQWHTDGARSARTCRLANPHDHLAGRGDIKMPHAKFRADQLKTWPCIRNKETDRQTDIFGFIYIDNMTDNSASVHFYNKLH